MYIKHGGVLRIPPHPKDTLGMTLWKNPVTPKLYLYEVYISGTLTKRIGNRIGTSYTIESENTVLHPVWKWLNGYCYFAGGAYCLWYYPGEGWIISSTVGILPEETWTPDDPENIYVGEYKGDEWWYSYSLGSESTTFVGRGSLRGTQFGGNNGGESLAITPLIEYYQRDEEAFREIAGVYKYKGSEEEDDITVGLPQFKNQNDKTYIRSLELDDNDFYSYGDIYHDNNNEKWIIGNYNSPGGWWEGVEPNVDSSVTFEFIIPEDVDLTTFVVQNDLVISFDKYVTGSNTISGYGFNVGRWN